MPNTSNKVFNEPVWVVSDAHLGVDAFYTSRTRELHLVRWLELAAQNCQRVVLLGDIFDFWFEWKHAVPKGFTRLLGKLAQLSDQGIKFHFFPGNHDMWTFGYLQQELNIQIHWKPEVWTIQGRQVYLGHGDGLGPGDYSYKAIKRIFQSHFFQWGFARLHPNFSFGLASFLSKRSRKAGGNHAHFLGENKEWLLLYSKDLSHKFPNHLFLFGHRHLPMHYPLPNHAFYLNTGDWLQYFSFVRIEMGSAALWIWEPDGSPRLEFSIP